MLSVQEEKSQIYNKFLEACLHPQGSFRLKAKYTDCVSLPNICFEAVTAGQFVTDLILYTTNALVLFIQ